MQYLDFRCRITHYTAPNIDIVKILEGIYDSKYNKEIPCPSEISMLVN